MNEHQCPVCGEALVYANRTNRALRGWRCPNAGQHYGQVAASSLAVGAAFTFRPGGPAGRWTVSRHIPGADGVVVVTNGGVTEHLLPTARVIPA